MTAEWMRQRKIPLLPAPEAVTEKYEEVSQSVQPGERAEKEKYRMPATEHSESERESVF